MSNNSDKAAYARPASSSSGSNLQQDGLTKRELISAMCLQGILANHAIALPGTNANNKIALAIVHADTLLSQLEKTKQHE